MHRHGFGRLWRCRCWYGWYCWLKMNLSCDFASALYVCGRRRRKQHETLRKEQFIICAEIIRLRPYVSSEVADKDLKRAPKAPRRKVGHKGYQSERFKIRQVIKTETQQVHYSTIVHLWHKIIHFKIILNQSCEKEKRHLTPWVQTLLIPVRLSEVSRGVDRVHPALLLSSKPLPPSTFNIMDQAGLCMCGRRPPPSRTVLLD